MKKASQLCQEIENRSDMIDTRYDKLILRYGEGLSSKKKFNHNHIMNKRDLKKLSKSELMELLLKQQNKRNPKS